jgi:hypothetical protein
MIYYVDTMYTPLEGLLNLPNLLNLSNLSNSRWESIKEAKGAMRSPTTSDATDSDVPEEKESRDRLRHRRQRSGGAQAGSGSS